MWSWLSNCVTSKVQESRGTRQLTERLQKGLASWCFISDWTLGDLRSVSARGFWIWLLLTPPTTADLVQDLCHAWTSYCSDVYLLHFLKYRSEQVTFLPSNLECLLPLNTRSLTWVASSLGSLMFGSLIHLAASAAVSTHPHCASTSQKCCQALPRPFLSYLLSSDQPPPLLIQSLPSHPLRPN